MTAPDWSFYYERVFVCEVTTAVGYAGRCSVPLLLMALGAKARMVRSRTTYCDSRDVLQNDQERALQHPPHSRTDQHQPKFFQVVIVTNVSS